MTGAVIGRKVCLCLGVVNVIHFWSGHLLPKIVLLRVVVQLPRSDAVASQNNMLCNIIRHHVVPVPSLFNEITGLGFLCMLASCWSSLLAMC